MKGKYSIDKEEDYDPNSGIPLNYGILLIPTADASTKVTVESTMNDMYNSPDKEKEVFDKLRSLNPDSDFLDNIIKPEGLKKMMDEATVPNKKGIHTLKFPGGITMMINVT